MTKSDKTCIKKPKINKVQKNTIKINIWKFIDQRDLDSRKFGDIPNLTGIYFKSKKEAIEWKKELIKDGKLWNLWNLPDVKLFKIDINFKESK